LYIGMAQNRGGLKGRCHFSGRTVNHSPRKSLAVLLMRRLALTPAFVPKPNARDTWGLDDVSDARLSEWMHMHLELAIEACGNPEARETELVSFHSPPLNLTKCVQTKAHRRISAARHAVMATLRPKTQREATVTGSADWRPQAGSNERAPPPVAARQLDGVDSAEAIAARYGFNPKAYRQRLRETIPWYRKPQIWTFEVGSTEWHDMIDVAEEMCRQ
jgi:hypothetical protein